MGKRPDMVARNKANAKHGMTNTKTHNAWCSMRERCLNPRHRFYDRYGGRGIIICERWSEFLNFLADMGEAKPGMTLDRINNDGNYEPGNCRWTSMRTQTLNRSTSRFVTALGKTQNLEDWENETGLSHQCIRYRLKAGWSPDDAVSTPKNHANAWIRGTR